MNDLAVTLVQEAIIADDPAANLHKFARLLSSMQEKTDLVILPEVFTTGFHPRARQHAELMGGNACQWMLSQARQLQAVVTGSLVVRRDDGEYVNRLLWATPEGRLDFYDKRHLFRMAGEHQRYAAGSERKLWTVKGWRVLPQICYDLRFPVWSRNRDDYDLALYVANWPAARQDHWLTLLKARAIENLAVVAGVNRIGEDVQGQEYVGGSCIFNARGETLVNAADAAGCFSVTLSGSELATYRQGFPAHLDADHFVIDGNEREGL